MRWLKHYPILQGIHPLGLKKAAAEAAAPRASLRRHRNEITNDRSVHQLVRFAVFVADKVAENLSEDLRPHSQTVERFGTPGDDFLPSG